jgi:hypothetical protein
MLVAACMLAACEPDVGGCADPNGVRTVVYDEDGAPAYEGQALVIASCGYGGLCHAEGIDAEQRYGAPAGLDYDLRPAGIDGTVDLAEVDRLRRMRDRVHAHRGLIWASVSAGRMPVGGEVGADIRESAPRYTYPNGDAPLPGLDTVEGREILREWLACGSPVVERIEPATAIEGYIPVGEPVSTIERVPLEPSWADIYERLIVRRCAGAPCHGEQRQAELDLRGDAATVLQTLLDGRARGRDCLFTDAPLLVPGQPDQSLFFQKLNGRNAEGRAVCGDLMPIGALRLSEASLAAVRTWIEAGAQP